MTLSDRTFRRYSRGSKINYAIIVLTFLLIASNQVFETTPLRASGTIEITEGTTIPQDNSYEISSTLLPSVTSAVIFNESIDDRYFRFDLPKERMSKVIVNVSLQYRSANVTSRLSLYFGQFSQLIDVIVGPNPTTYSFEPNMNEVHYAGSSWMTSCSINTGDNRLMLHRIVVWAEYEVPVSPIVLNLETSDGHPLFENDYTRQIRNHYPIIEMTPANNSQYEFRIRLQNRTLYVVPQTFVFEPGWYYVYTERTEFNVTVAENEALTCLIHLSTVRLEIAIEPIVPIVILSINLDSYEDTYELYLKNQDIPEYLYLPPYPTVAIEVATPDLLSSSPSYYTDIHLRESISYNVTKNLHLDVTMQYLSVFGLAISPQDLIQIFLVVTLYVLLIAYLSLYMYEKKQRITLKDPRIIPLLLILVTAVIPWFSAIRTNILYSETQITILSTGVFPIFSAWIDSGMFTLVIPSFGVYWVIASVLLFWMPLFYANYSTSPPSTKEENYNSAYALFAPYLLFFMQKIGLDVQFNFEFTPLVIIQIILIAVPAVNLLILFALNHTGRFAFGPKKNRLAMDVKLSNELRLLETPEAIVESPTAFIKKVLPEKRELQKELKLILMIFLFLLSMLPTAICSVYELSGSNYLLDEILFNTPVFSIGLFIRSLFGSSGLFMSCIYFSILFYILTFGIFGEFVTKTEVALSLILILLWLGIPLLLIMSLSYTSYFQGVEWILVTTPYFLLSCVTVRKINNFIWDEINIRDLLLWIVIPLVAIIPGWLVLNWIAVIQMNAMVHQIQSWIPFPLYTLIFIILILPLKKWIRNKSDQIEVDQEMDEVLFSDDVIDDS